MGKRFTLRLFTLILLSLLVSTSIIIIKGASGHRPMCDISCSDHDDDDHHNDCRMRLKDKLVTKSLKTLRSVVSRLPKQAFKDPENAKDQKKELHSMISTVIKLVKHREYKQALNMLEQIENAIREWIRHCWQTCLIKKVKYIIWLIEWILCRDWKPPTIVTVLRYPETPNYDEPVTVIAHVIDKQSGVQLVNLSYSINTINWVNVTMESIDGLYVAEIPPQSYNTTENYKVYAWDEAGNLAISETYSYVVDDFCPPIISCVYHKPLSPNYNENVTVFANVTEPPEASGVKNVTLWYKTDSEWQHIEMTLNQLYTGIIPAFPYQTEVQYKIHAFDYADNRVASQVYSYTVGAPPPNLPPVAIFTESATEVPTGEVITFNASASYDLDGFIVSYFWDFGDGTNASGVVVDHAYAENGTYIVTLTVTDNDGESATATATKTVGNRLPIPLFTESATIVLTNEVIEFDASVSYDPDGTIVSYFWDFGDGTSTTGIIVEHRYVDDGVYTVTLTVTDNDGATATYASIKVVLNRRPVASFIENATLVLTGEVIHFDASGSEDPDGSIISFFWNFGDGTNATGVIVDHAYSSSGTYTVTLKVTDDDGAVDFASSTETVLPPLPPNQPPVAVFTESATTVFTNDIIKFNASASYDIDGTIDSYSWNFGDGNVATGAFVEHSYADDGVYNVTLTVTDNEGATDTATSTKYVWNRSPIASFTESAEIIYTDEVVTFNATSSHDPDGLINNYFWDFGDGTNGTGITAEHAYSEDGVYIVVLTVTDDDGSTATFTSTKTVLNRPPVASFNLSATTVLTGEDTYFDASNSEDSDGHVICYIWDFGDGTSASGVSVSHAYKDNGIYTVTLTVIDDDGASSSTSAVEKVLNRPPIALFTVNVTKVKKDEAIRFDASESHDPDGSIVSYFWDFGDGTNTTGLTANHTYVEDGNYTVTLTIIDDDGASSSADITITVETPVGWPLALLAMIILAIVALTITVIYVLYSRKIKKTATKIESPVITLFVPAELLIYSKWSH